MDSGVAFKRRLYMPRTSMTTEGNRTGSWRFLRPRYEEKTSPCSAACPVGEDIPRVEMLVTQGAFKEAWETILLENPLPGVCGRVCFHPCEGKCNRKDFDTPVAIHTLERFLSDTAFRNETKPVLPRRPPTGKRVAVVGSGPAGLSAAWFLTILGYECDVLEAMEEAGGLLRWGIPEYRLPRSELQREIGRIVDEGVRIHTGERVKKERFEELRTRYDALLLGCGLWKNRPLGISGEDVPGVEDGLTFLRRVRGGERPAVGGVNAIIGGGNTAVDVARSVVRLGGEAVIVYRRRREDMPAFFEEIEGALEEGVEIKELLAPSSIAARNGGLVLTLRRMMIEGKDKDGRGRIVPAGTETLSLEVARVFVATGADTAETWHLPPAGNDKTIRLSRCLLSFEEGVPVAYVGDLAGGDLNVTAAIASGKEAVMALDSYFKGGCGTILEDLSACRVGDGTSLSMEIYLGGARKARSRHVVTYEEINTDYFSFEPRITQPRLLPDERRLSFDEIEMKLSAGTAMREAGRCFNCGICNGCDNCWLYCPDVAVIRQRRSGERLIDYNYCKGCGLCVVECPRNAMALEEEGGS